MFVYMCVHMHARTCASQQTKVISLDSFGSKMFHPELIIVCVHSFQLIPYQGTLAVERGRLGEGKVESEKQIQSCWFEVSEQCSISLILM